MVDNNLSPSSFSSNFKNEYLENIVSHTTTTNNNETLLMPPTSSAQTFSNGYTDLPQDPREETTKSSSKKRKGRPQGSRNKPKSRIIIKENREALTEVVTIKISVGEDIMEALINYAIRRQTDIVVSRGFGLVCNVTLLDPVSCVPLLPIEGPLHMTSLFGTYVNPNFDCIPPQFIANPPCSSFTIYFSGINGHVFGGVVGGKIIAAGVIFINATLVKKTAFHRAVSIKRNDREIEEGGSIFEDGVIMNVDHVAHESHNNNNNNNNNNIVFHMFTSFNNESANSTQPNHQMSHNYLHTEESSMPWNHSAHSENF
ncbi:AT-hook motif nuclear-localized protein 16-like [Vicia villosa]|uniref:AT-hook motif nuclear-localized protein 16-like n=1 Tax=Vicia villosa TaxID=3911 RepID=UPI00273B057B|nr:AT-hook motif nuclear-localized protein 16-like [Vicia villosa]